NEKKLNFRQNEWCPEYGDKKSRSLVFTSPREGASGNKLDNCTGQSFKDLFIVTKDRRGNWSKPSLLDKEDMVNTNANEGPACFNKRFSTLYFTRCAFDKKKDLACKIYTSTKKGKGWKEAELLPLVPESVDAIHPSISDDGLTLYFCSNLPGGQGDMDIWVARRAKKSKAFGTPENLGPVINTAEKDEFPYLRNDTVLYFASKGHLGLGSYDIFVAKKTKDGDWGKPENLKYPVNSTWDDFGIVFHPAKDEGYFTSNRKGGRGSDDIYYFVLPPLIYTLKGTIRDEKTLKSVQSVTVNLEGSDGSAVEIESGIDGVYFFDSTKILPAVTYEIKISKKDFFNASDRITTVALENSKNFTMDFLLIPIERKPIVLPEILYDFARWNIKPQYRDSLSNLVQILMDNENIVIELLSHTDMVGSEESNLDLSQKRAQSAIDYLISRDIDPKRLKAIGYGENQPRVLKKDVTRGIYTFNAGTTLTEDYIKSLPSRKKQAVANQLNRRTEFRVISEDFEAVDKTLAAVITSQEAAVKPTVPKPKPQPKPKPKPKPQPKPTATATATATATIPVYTVQVGAGNLSLSKFSNLEDIKKCKGKDGITRFVTGAFQTRDEAVQYSKRVKTLGYKDAWPVKVDENRKACFE
ncbi:MAG: OmpA family protein, partial [Bacteroidales bacterium]|nr:OmpA family protein [Bacteroidales bacterium]